jgi:CheY-like chemotaxis protein
VTPAVEEAPVIIQAGAAAEARARKKGTSTTAAPAVRVRHKILVADDEDNFCSFISWVLKENGYDVLIANDGQEAFERFQSAPKNIDMVILDAYMPRMGGLEAYLRMQVLRPDLPVLFASGFVGGPSADTLVESCPGPAGILHKPFTSEDLLQAVKTALAV